MRTETLLNCNPGGGGTGGGGMRLWPGLSFFGILRVARQKSFLHLYMRCLLEPFYTGLKNLVDPVVDLGQIVAEGMEGIFCHNSVFNIY